MSVRPVRVAASVLVAVATALVLVALAVVPFLSPAWVAFEQGRADSVAWTGFTTSELRTATNAILADLVLGPPAFDVAVRGEPVLNERERGHLSDVRTVFIGFGVAAIAAILVLVLAARRWPRLELWRAVRAGALGLAGAVALIGVVGLIAFEVAFEVFHRLFFAGGTYTFDPATERLVQLFPQTFWFETSMAVGAVILVLCGAVVVLASRQLRYTPTAPAAARRTSLEGAR